MRKVLSTAASATALLALYAQTALAQINVNPPGEFGNLPKDVSQVSGLVTIVLQVLLINAAVVYYDMLLWGGIRWITSGGDKANTQSARSTITAALIGLVIVFSAWIIANIIGNIFNIDIFNISIPNLNTQ